MSGRDINSLDDIRSELNVVEQLTAGASAVDEYLEALVRLQMVQINSTQLGTNKAAFGGIDTQDLPEGFAGIALEDIPAGKTGSALFDISGSRLVTEVDAITTDVTQDDVVRIIQDNNGVAVSKSINKDDILGGIGSSGTNPDRFEVWETPEAKSVGAGDTVDVIDVEFDGPAIIYESGLSDIQDTRYEYLVDGEPIFNEKLFAPLGLYNNMYRYPEPLAVQSSFVVRAHRDGTASGPEDFIGKTTHRDISR
mgnify:CR=1 FL=1